MSPERAPFREAGDPWEDAGGEEPRDGDPALRHEPAPGTGLSVRETRNGLLWAARLLIGLFLAVLLAGLVAWLLEPGAASGGAP